MFAPDYRFQNDVSRLIERVHSLWVDDTNRRVCSSVLGSPGVTLVGLSYGTTPSMPARTRPFNVRLRRNKCGIRIDCSSDADGK